jgi:hypothetical protein
MWPRERGEIRERVSAVTDLARGVPAFDALWRQPLVVSLSACADARVRIAAESTAATPTPVRRRLD